MFSLNAVNVMTTIPALAIEAVREFRAQVVRKSRQQRDRQVANEIVRRVERFDDAVGIIRALMAGDGRDRAEQFLMENCDER